jgi:hypothetical protein
MLIKEKNTDHIHNPKKEYTEKTSLSAEVCLDANDDQ